MSNNSPPKTPENLRKPEDNEEKPASASSRKKSPLSRVPSALTVENLKKHEEETDALDVVELMSKNTEDAENQEHPRSSVDGQDAKLKDEDVEVKSNEPTSPTPEDSPNIETKVVSEGEKESSDAGTEAMDEQKDSQKKEESERFVEGNEPAQNPISLREEVRGFKLTGEEYLAISIDVQTDESYLAEYFEYNGPRKGSYNVEEGEFQSGRVPALAASDGSATPPRHRRRKHITSDISTLEIGDEESVLHVSKSGESDRIKKKIGHSSAAESETEDDNVVTEITESADSEALTQTTHGTTQTLPSVGPPSILQYKPESKVAQVNYKEVEVAVPDNINLDDLSEEQRQYYTKVMEDMRKIKSEKSESRSPREDLISIQPHSAYGSRQERRITKDRERERSRAREMKMQSRQTTGGASGQLMANQTNFCAFARQLKTVNYTLSSEKFMEQGWTIRPSTPKTPEEIPPEVFVYDPMQDVISGKRFQRNFVQKFHPNGVQFLAVFPDGTGNVWYQSGNVAISIIATDKVGKLTFIVHDDVPLGEGENIQGVFEPNGHCTCYYPKGVIRLLLTHIGGQYFNPHGDRVKKWQWKDQQTHVHAPPFQPITFSLSKIIGVRVMSQELIYLTFTDGSRSVRFNVGTRLRFKATAFLPKVDQLDPDLVLLNEKRYQIRSIVERVNNNMKFPNSPRLKKLKLPTYLVTQLEKSVKTREQLLLQEQEAGTIKMKQRSSAASKKSSQTLPSPQLPRRRLTRLPRYPEVVQVEFEEVKPVVIVN